MRTLGLALALILTLGLFAAACDGGDDATPGVDTHGSDTVGGVDTTPGADIPAVSGTIELTHAGAAYPAGTSYNVPDNNDPASSNLPLFSLQKDLMTIRNTSDGAVTLHAVTLTEADGVLDEEWQILDAAQLGDHTLELVDTEIAAGGIFDFYLACQPVYSGERAATLTLNYTDAEGTFDYVVPVTGTGRPSDNAVPFVGGTLDAHKVLGNIDTDEQATGLVADEAGNSYVLMQTKVVPGYDSFYYDLVLGKITPDGTLAWAKIYSRKSAWEWCPDPGQNDETGGSPNALSLGPDGALYVAGNMSDANTNNNNAVHVMKVDTEDGSLVWDVLWRPEWTDGTFLDRMGAGAYAVAAAGGRVFVTGHTGDGNVNGVMGSGSSVLLLALDAVDGAQIFAQAADVAATYNDRGHAVAADAAGANVFVGGLTNGRGLLMKWTGTDTDAPELAWVKKLNMGTGSNVYGIDEDGGDAYLALDRRGASTFFSVARFAGADGSAVWAKTYQGNNGDNNNCNVVTVSGDWVYAGGRIGISTMDSQMGDGMILRLGKADGALGWAGHYYTGKSPNEIEEHRIKGIAIVGDALYLGGQVYTGSNGDANYRYDGYWYDGLGTLEDFEEIEVIDATADVGVFEPTNGAVKAVADHHEEVAFDDLPEDLAWLDAAEKMNGLGGTVDEEYFWMKLTLK
jgi:hypothetical protein